MITLPPDIIDSRQQFEERFNTIATERSIATTGLLRARPVSVASTPADNAAASENLNEKYGNCHGTLVVPGLLGNSLRATIAPFLCARERLSVKDYDIEVAWVSGRSGCKKNAATLRRRVLEASEQRRAPVNLICYSKGCADALHMIGQYPDTHASIRALVSYAGVVSGSPLADSAPVWMSKALQYLPLPGEAHGDGHAIQDLTTGVREHWLSNHVIPSHIRLASVLAAPKPTQVSRILQGTYRKLGKINRYNDSQMIANDSLLPGGELLAVVNADHWAIALPIAEKHMMLSRLIVDKNNFPRDVLLQAIIDYLQFTSAPQSGNPEG